MQGKGGGEGWGIWRGEGGGEGRASAEEVRWGVGVYWAGGEEGEGEQGEEG